MAKPVKIEVAGFSWEDGRLVVVVNLLGEITPADKKARAVELIEHHEFFEHIPEQEAALFPYWHELPVEWQNKVQAFMNQLKAEMGKYLK